MYEGDSFFTLSAFGQIGLAALSLALACSAIAGLWFAAAGKPIWVRLTIAVLIFVFFVWVSPQIYYQYYRLIFDGLPAQWVIGGPPGARHYLTLMTFRADANLSNHSQGALGWTLMAMAVLRRRRT